MCICMYMRELSEACLSRQYLKVFVRWLVSLKPGPECVWMFADGSPVFSSESDVDSIDSIS